MGEELTEAVRRALRAVRDPETGRDVVDAGMVQGLAARDGLVQFALAVPRERARELEPLRQAAERAAAGVSGVLSATAVPWPRRGSAAQLGGAADGPERRWNTKPSTVFGKK